jgi:hypothetical protein
MVAPLMTNRAPLIVAIVLLLLPVLYVGSYLAMVVPEGIVTKRERVFGPGPAVMTTGIDCYRFGNDYAKRFYWPLEKIDRRLRFRRTMWSAPP